MSDIASLGNKISAIPNPKLSIQRIDVNLATQRMNIIQNDKIVDTLPVAVGRQDVNANWLVNSVPGGVTKEATPRLVDDTSFPRVLDAIGFSHKKDKKTGKTTPNIDYFGTGAAAVDIVNVDGTKEGGTNSMHELLPSRLPGTLASWGCFNVQNFKKMLPKDQLKNGVGFDPNYPKIGVRSQYGLSGTQYNIKYDEETHTIKNTQTADQEIDAEIAPHLMSEVTLAGNKYEPRIKVKTPEPGLARTIAKILREHPELKLEDIVPVNSMSNIPKTVTKKTIYILKEDLASLLKQSKKKNPQFYDGSAAQTALKIYNKYTDNGSNAAPKSDLETLKPKLVNGRIAIIKNP